MSEKALFGSFLLEKKIIEQKLTYHEMMSRY